jgi:hypothetical protein
MADLVRYEREITLQREHGTRPAADLVTGNLDARKAAFLRPAEGVTQAPDNLVEEAEGRLPEEVEG